MILFDVPEHIERKEEFLDAAMFLVKEGGQALINFPALQHLYSQYDRRAGHLRRYSLAELLRNVSALGLQVRGSTYKHLLGISPSPFPLDSQAAPSVCSFREDHSPRLRSRKQTDEWAMYLISHLEPIPQRLSGKAM